LSSPEQALHRSLSDVRDSCRRLPLGNPSRANCCDAM
jgi:hypothetical protein